jgi:hypothetical protein
MVRAQQIILALSLGRGDSEYAFIPFAGKSQL